MSQDLKATLKSPNNGFIYEKTKAISIAVEISNESVTALSPNDSVLIRFYLDGTPLALKQGNDIKTEFRDLPPYPLGGRDSSSYTFSLQQVVLMINDTITGSRVLCAEIDLLTAPDTNFSNNRSCINLLLPPPKDTTSQGVSYAAVLTPTGYAGNLQNFQLYVQGGPASFSLKVTKPGYGDCGFLPRLSRDSASGTLLAGRLNLKYADTGKWDVVIMDGTKALYVLPAAYEVRRRSLTGVRPDKLANFGRDSLYISGSGLPGINLGLGSGDSASTGVLLLINESDTIGPINNFRKLPEARGISVFNMFTRIEGGVYDILLVLDGWDSLKLEKSIILDPPERYFDFSISNYTFGATNKYKSGDAATLSTNVLYGLIPDVPVPDSADSVALHFTMNGAPLRVVINGVEDSVHVLPGNPISSGGTSRFVYNFPGSYFLFDSSARGNAEICITVYPLTIKDTLLQNNTICKTFSLTPASPEAVRPAIHEIRYEDVYDCGIHPITLVGARLPVNSVIRLFKAGSPDIRAIDSMTRAADPSRELTACFDLTNADTGWWDMMLLLPGGDTVVSRGAVYIKGLEVVQTWIDTMEQRGHKEVRFRVNTKLQNVPDIEVVFSNGLDSFYLDKLKITRYTQDTSAYFSGMSYPYLIPVGVYDLIVRMKGKDVLKKNALVVRPRRLSDSITVSPASGFYVSINRISAIAADEGNVLDVLLKPSAVANTGLNLGDSLEFRIRIDSSGLLLRRDGVEDSVFRFRIDTANARIKGLGIDSIRFTALLPDVSLDSFSMRNLCMEIKGLNFVDTKSVSARTHCKQIMIPAVRPERGALRIANETIGNNGTSLIRIMGESNWSYNYHFKLQRPGVSPIDLDWIYTKSEMGGEVYVVAVYTTGLYLGDWELVGQTQDTIIRKPVKVMQSAIRQVGPRRFGIQSGAQFEWAVLIRTEYIDTGLGTAWLSNASGNLYADEVRKVSGQQDLYRIRFKSPPQNLTAGDYDLNLTVNGANAPFVLKHAVALEAPLEKELDITISGPGEVRAGFWQPYLLQVTNPSNIEVPGVIIPFATTYDSVSVEGLSVLHVTSDSFNGAVMGDWRVGVLSTGKMGPQESRTIRLKAVTHRALTEPAELQAGLFSIVSTRDAASGVCLAANLTDWLGWPSNTIAPACLSNALQQQGGAAVMDFAAAVTGALVTCGGYNGDADSLRTLVTRSLAARGADRSADSCNALYRPISNYRAATKVLWSYDPNDKYGPHGAGHHHYLDTGRKDINYVIRFENDSSASAPAQIVRIVDTLDKKLFDLSSFRLGDVWVADSLVLEGGGRSFFDHYKDFMLHGRSYVLHIRAAADTSTGVIEWILTTLDKHTMELTKYARGGFLPPNIISTEGQGSVSFSIRPKDNLPHDIPVRNRAYIYFDINPPIITDEFENRLDASGPSSSVLPLPSYIPDDSTVRLRWDGTDSGSGIQSYSLFVSRNGAAYEEWLSATTEKEVVFTGNFGSTYAFYSVATDSVGNRELPPASYDAVTRFIRCSDVLSLTLDTSGPVQFCKGGQVSLSVTGGQYYAWNNGADSSVIHITGTGAYQVTITDTFGCMLQSDTVFTTVFDLPEAPVIRRSADTLYSDKTSGNQWYRNAGKLQGATDSFYSLSLPGSYQVSYTDSNGCTSFSEEMKVAEGVSAGGLVQANRGISVYPNPSDIFTITGEAGGGEVKIMVFDMQGKLILYEQKPAMGTEFLYRLDLSVYPPAAYWLYVHSGTAFYSGKLVRP